MDVITYAKVKSLKSQVESLNQKMTKSLCLYYGYPIIFGDWSIDSAITRFSNYDIIVLGASYWDTTHEQYSNTMQIIAGVKAVKPSVEIFGYVPIGVAPESTADLTLAQIQTRIDGWLAIGATGIFLDEFGFDYRVTRQRQNDCVDYAHSLGLTVMANSWNIDYVFQTAALTLDWIPDFEPNPDSIAPSITSADYYMFENLFFLYDDDEQQGASSWRVNEPVNYYQYARTEYAGKTYHEQFGTQTVALDCLHSATPTATRTLYSTVGMIGSKILNIDVYGISVEDWGAGGITFVDFVVPDIKELIEDSKHAITVTAYPEPGEYPYRYTATINGVSWILEWNLTSEDNHSLATGTRQISRSGVAISDAWADLLVMANELNVLTGEIDSGWKNESNGCTYDTANSFMIAGNVVENWPKGLKMRCKQGGEYKYFSVIGAAYSDPNTTITITGGIDFVLTDAVITDVAWSKSDLPIGFPEWFNWTPVLTGYDSMTITDTTIALAKFKVCGGELRYQVRFNATFGGTASNVLRVSLPFATAMSAEDPAGSGSYKLVSTHYVCNVVMWGNNEIRISRYSEGDYATGEPQQKFTAQGFCVI